jgi:hypothetical protein
MSKSKIFAQVAEIANKREEKVELSKAAIELGLVESMQKALDSSRKLESSLRAADKDMTATQERQKELEKEYVKAQKMFEKSQDAFFKQEKKVDGTLSKIDELLDKAKRAASELGIKAANVDGYKELEQARKDLAKARVGK